MEEGHRALGVMDKHLALHDFFAADRYTIADIALYAYTHVAHQCDYDLDAVSGGSRLARARRRRAWPRANGLQSGCRRRCEISSSPNNSVGRSAFALS